MYALPDFEVSQRYLGVPDTHRVAVGELDEPTIRTHAARDYEHIERTPEPSRYDERI